jgi:PAS domain S-box-containing protein
MNEGCTSMDRVKEVEKENEALKKQIKLLERELNEQDQLKFQWAGSLGRWELNLKTKKVKYNPLKLKALGFEPGEIDPDMYDFVNRIHPGDYDQAMQAMRDHISGKKPVYETEYRIRTKKGDYKTFYDRGKIIKYDEFGQPEVVVGIVFDITEKRQVEEQLKESITALKKENELTNQILSIISHDLRGTIGAISSLIDLFLHDEYQLEEEEKNRFLSDINISAKSSLSILENLLNWSRNAKGKIKADFEVFDLTEVVNDVISFNRSVIASKGIAIDNKLQNAYYVKGDRDMIHTVVRNLINNALKYTQKDGRIVINQSSDAQILYLTVKDNGIGMDERKLKEINFPKVKSTEGTSGETGTGLGLFLVRDFLKKNKGRLEIFSVKGEGTTVKIGLELA